MFTWVLKKIFPTPGGFIYMCVDIYARVLLHVCGMEL